MLVCVFLCAFLHTRPRVQRAPGLPCALFFLGEPDCKTRAPCVARRRKRVHVIAKSTCDEAIQSSLVALDCFVAALLAMTALKRSRHTLKRHRPPPGGGLRRPGGG